MNAASAQSGDREALAPPLCAPLALGGTSPFVAIEDVIDVAGIRPGRDPAPPRKSRRQPATLR